MEIDPARNELYMHMHSLEPIIEQLSSQISIDHAGDCENLDDVTQPVVMLIEIFEFMAQYQNLSLSINESYIILRDDLHRAMGTSGFTPVELSPNMVGRCMKSAATKGMREVYNNPANKATREIEANNIKPVAVSGDFDMLDLVPGDEVHMIKLVGGYQIDLTVKFISIFRGNIAGVVIKSGDEMKFPVGSEQSSRKTKCYLFKHDPSIDRSRCYWFNKYGIAN
jgi:hypothetical protein